MSTAFPGAIDVFVNPGATDNLNTGAVLHHLQHANANDAIAAIEALLFNKTNMNLAASVLVPGATSFAVRDTANARNNLLLLNSGALTVVGQAGSGASDGAGHSFTTGAAGTGTAQGGPFTINLGAGTNATVQRGWDTGHDGQFRIKAPAITNSTVVGAAYDVFEVNSNGIGIGAAAQAGVPINAQWIDTDPTYDTGYTFVNNVIFTSNNATNPQVIQTGMHLFGPGASTGGSTAGSVDAETNIYSTGTPTHELVRCGYFKVHFKPTSGTLTTNTASPPTAASATLLYALAGQVFHQGTGTIVKGIGVLGAVTLASGSGGANDPLGTTLTAFSAQNVLNGTTASPNNTTVPNLYGYWVEATGFAGGSTAVATTVYGVRVDSQTNTIGHTSTTGGFTAGAAYFTVSNQGGNTAGIDTNYGVVITGNGGAPGAGGAVSNFALFSNSSALTSIFGNLVLGDNSAPSAATARAVIYLHGTGTSGTTQYGIDIAQVLQSDATSQGTMLHSVFRTAAAAFTMSTGNNVHLDTPIIGASSAVTNYHALQIANQGNAGMTNSYAIRVLAQTGAATKSWALVTEGGFVSLTPTVTIASASGAVWAGVTVPATTATVTGSTNITTAGGFNLITLGQPTISNASISVARAATLAIANAPTASGGCSITLALALDVQAGNIGLGAGTNFVLDTATGTKIGTATSQKIGLWNATPVTQPTASTNANTPAAGSTTNVFTNTTFDGGVGGSAWTIGGLVAALKLIGAIQA